MVTIGFSTTKGGIMGVLPALIRWLTNSPYSHTWIRYSHNLYEIDVVAEAGIKGIVEQPYIAYMTKISNITELIAPARIDIRKGLPAVGVMLATEYDFKSLLGRAVTFIGKLFKQKWGNPLGNSRKDCCVELVIRCLKKADPNSYKDLQAEEESPASLYARLIKDGWKPIS